MNTLIVKLILLFSMSMLACGLAQATSGQGLEVIEKGLPHHALLSIAFDGQSGISVGNYGEIQTSTDGGQRWAKEANPSGAGAGLFGVASRAGLRIIVGQSGAILVSHKGAPWERVDSGLTERLMSVSIGSDGRAVAVGGFGAITMSADEGRSWTPIQIDWSTLMPNVGTGVVPHLYAVVLADDGSITVAGEYSGIFRSPDQGKTWEVLNRGGAPIDPAAADAGGDPPPVPPSIFSLDVTADGHLYAVGQEGLILRSEDNGCSFEQQELNTKSLLFAVKALPDGNAIAAGMYSMVYTVDQGKTWRKVDDPSIKTSWYSGAERSPGGDGAYLVVGKAATITRFKP